MSKTYLIRLEEDDLGQIIEGLQAREESWRKTADYFRSGYNADKIAQFYSRIIRDLERQRDEQRNAGSLA